MTQLVDYASIHSLPQIWPRVAQQFGNILALNDPHSKPTVQLTYGQVHQQIQQFASGLQALGVKPDAKVALFADNSPRWLIADQGSIAAGAANVVRSAQADVEELRYILQDSDSSALMVENRETLKRLGSDLEQLPLKCIFLLSDETPPPDAASPIHNFAQILDAGRDRPLDPVSQTKATLATLIYTSGTTGKPKGVMLTHGNLLHQVTAIGKIIQPEPGDVALSILPTWHSYERSCEYFLLSQGVTLVYTSIRTFKGDLKKIKPNFMVGVPRLWESIYEGIQKQFRDQPASRQKLVDFLLQQSEAYVQARRISQGLSLEHLNASISERLLASVKALLWQPLHGVGDRLIYAKVRQGLGNNVKSFISGGGSLATHIDTFFEIINVPILVGYGLTETAPVTNARTLKRNFCGTSGLPAPETQIRIVDPVTRKTLPQGERGLVLIRGPQVMQGYYKKPDATAKVIDADGWFDSGDLGWLTAANDLVLTGRAKDTIVLTNGENIEPQPIEDACARSQYIDQIMLLGQDERSLGALIVPNYEALEAWSHEQNLALTFPQPNHKGESTDAIYVAPKPVQNLLRQELNREVKNRAGYRSDDRIGPFNLLLEPFTIENGMLTQTLKIKRPVVRERYHAIIVKMFAN